MSRNLTGTDLKRLHRDWRRRTDGRLALLVDGAQGPFNIGAIIRTAAAERVEYIWFAAGATTPDNSKVGKTALYRPVRCLVPDRHHPRGHRGCPRCRLRSHRAGACRWSPA